MCVLQTNKGDEQTDTNRYCNLQARRNRIKDCFTHICQGQDNKDNTLNKYCSQSNFPAITHAQDNRIGEVSIQTHTSGKYEGQVGKQRHTERADCRCQRSCCKNSTCIHSGCAEDARVNRKDIRHGHESCETGDDFCLHVGAVFFQFKKVFHRLSPPHTDNKQVQCNTVFRIWLSLFHFFLNFTESCIIT